MNNLLGRTLVLGVGAQRSGSTWLWRYLCSHEKFCTTPIKELHYFNSIWCDDRNSNARHIRSLREQVMRIPDGASKVSPTVIAKIQAFADRAAMIQGPLDAYLRYFSNRLQAGHTHFGEVTPAYSMLPVEGFRQIRELHPDTRIIFLMRDPVDRIYSAVKNEQKKRKVEDALEGFLPALTKSEFVARTRYDVTITNLRAAFPEHRIFLGFYETLFSERSIAALCSFLDLDFKEPAYAEVINEGIAAPSLPEGHRAEARRALKDVYEFCRAEFGSALPERWLA